jgi:phage-related minor tail protein
MREWRDNCIDIPVITRKLEAAQARSGLLNEECRALRERLSEKEELTRKLAKKQQQLMGSHDTTHNEV